MSTLIPWRARLSMIPRLAPWSDIDTLQDRLDRIRGRIPGVFPEETTEWLPAVDLEEKDEEFLLTAEFPGMNEKDVTVDVEGNTLTLKGEKKTEREEKKEKNGRWHLVERAWGSFERSFTLPSSVDTQKIKAEFKNGLLTVHLPKRETSTARRVPISGK
jgi:HSP20 family protein